MNHLMNKELAGGLYVKRGGQGPNDHVEHCHCYHYDKWYLQGSVLGLMLLSIFVVCTDSGIEGSLSKFTDGTELCDAVLLEGRNAIQGDLDKLKMWTCVRFMKFNKSKCKVLHLSKGDPQYTYRLGGQRSD